MIKLRTDLLLRTLLNLLVLRPSFFLLGNAMAQMRGIGSDGSYEYVSSCSPGSKCELYCYSSRCSSYSNNDYYDYCCELAGIDFSDVKEPDAYILDLSGLKLILDYIDSGYIYYRNFPKDQVETLILADNFYFFYRIDYLIAFVNQFPNLQHLDLSNITLP